MFHLLRKGQSDTHDINDSSMFLIDKVKANSIFGTLVVFILSCFTATFRLHLA